MHALLFRATDLMQVVEINLRENKDSFNLFIQWQSYWWLSVEDVMALVVMVLDLVIRNIVAYSISQYKYVLPV